jgi:hypothetical protein
MPSKGTALNTIYENKLYATGQSRLLSRILMPPQFQRNRLKLLRPRRNKAAKKRHRRGGDNGSESSKINPLSVGVLGSFVSPATKYKVESGT